MNQEDMPQARPQRHPWTLKKLQFRSSNAWDCGILWRLARDGQLIDVVARCPSATTSGVVGTSSRYHGADRCRRPTTTELKMHKGRLAPDNVRLAHRVCNQRTTCGG